MQSGLFLDIIIRQRTTVFKLFPSKDETLLIGRNTFLVLYLGFHVIDRVARLDVQGDGFAGQSLHEDLHATTEAQDKMQSGLFLDIIIRQRTTVFKLFPSKDETLLIRRNTFLVLDLGFPVIDR